MIPPITTYLLELSGMAQLNAPVLVETVVEYSLSLGILMLVVIMLYREWKDIRRYRQKQDDRLLDIAGKAIKVIEKAHNKFDLLADDLNDAMEKIDYKIEDLIERIKDRPG